MTIDTVKKSGKLSHNGVKLAAYSLFYPSLEAETIDDFCRRYAEAFEDAIRGNICERLTAEYEASTDSKKRFCTPSREISLVYRITRAADGLISMVWVASMASGKETIALSKSAQTWDSRNQYLLTTRDFGITGRRKATCNFFLENEEAVILISDRELRVPLKRKFRAIEPPMRQSDNRASP